MAQEEAWHSYILEHNNVNFVICKLEIRLDR